jgi:PleD family two-component response regulator
VEDDLDLAEMLNAYFRVQGYDVLTAAWGEDGVRLCQQNNPSIVVLDIRLPDIDGYEVCRRIRATRRTESIPIIFLTERRDRVDKLHGLELGVVDYITKPFDIQELRLRIRNTLVRSEQKSLINAVTGLSEGKLVDEQLDKLLTTTSWSVLVFNIQGLDSFRDMYGFVAADDVLRAISLMITNIVKEAGGESDFIGHLLTEELIIITSDSRVREIQSRIHSRMPQSMEYFYPLKDRSNPAPNDKRLSISTRKLDSTEGPFKDLKTIKALVLNVQR